MKLKMIEHKVSEGLDYEVRFNNFSLWSFSKYGILIDDDSYTKKPL